MSITFIEQFNKKIAEKKAKFDEIYKNEDKLILEKIGELQSDILRNVYLIRSRSDMSSSGEEKTHYLRLLIPSIIYNRQYTNPHVLEFVQELTKQGYKVEFQKEENSSNCFIYIELFKLTYL